MPGECDLQAFLLCDSMMRDAETGKSIISGVFDRIWAEKYPALHASLSVYFRFILPVAKSTFKMQLDFITPSGLRQSMPELPGSAGPRGIAEGAISIQGLPLPEPGDYTFELLIDGRRVAGYRLMASLAGEGNVPSPDNAN